MADRRDTAVLGVDFSGAKNAERKVWLAEGTLRGGVLHLDRVDPARDLFPAKGPGSVCAALCERIAHMAGGVVGVDAPFGLAREAAAGLDWRGLLMAVAAAPDAQEFRKTFGAPERRRRVDDLAKTPFAPTNLRLFRQTYFAMAGVAAPLVRVDAARFPPMQPVDATKPVVLETCPASHLKQRGLYGRPYKGPGREHRAARADLVRAAAQDGARLSPNVAALAEADRDGDALDAVLCAVIAARAWLRAPWRGRPAQPENVEADVFF